MNIEKFIHTPFRRGISGLWYISGDFGILDGTCKFTHTQENSTHHYHYETEQYQVSSEYTTLPGGVAQRRDTFQNLSGVPLTLNSFFCRFYLEGNQYEVYTQYNGWHHESSGAWQDLVTQVSAVSCGIRTCEGAAPMMALRNKHTGRITVFHLLPNCQWQMIARKLPHRQQNESVVLEVGFENNALRMPIAPGEQIQLPTVLFYETQNRTGFDAHKLHQAYNSLYPRRKMPIMYNTWFYHFDNIDVDAILRQVDCAAELGMEMFMVDSGWFGEVGSWSATVGDWKESLTSGFRGRLMEVSERVRRHGMIFGLWFEPERAGVESVTRKEHPEFYLDHVFFDFSRPDARDYMVGIISEVIDRYQIGFVKFDFNASTPHDPSGCAFYRYMQGHREFIDRLRQRYPDLYFTNCAAGGGRMELQQGSYFDSFWFSDNQGPYEGLTIVKNTLKRMPGSLIERWSVQKYCDGFPVYGTPQRQGFMLSCNNSVFDYVLNVKDNYTLAFLTGGPIGFSGDIAAYPADYKEKLKAFLCQYKEDRSFYLSAEAHILVDSEDITVIEYADSGLSRCVIQFFTKLINTDALTVYPAVDAAAQYLLNGTCVSGQTLIEDGLRFENLTYNDCQILELRKV